MNPDIIIPTCKDKYEISPLVCNVEGHSIGCRVIATCQKTSAAINRNAGLDISTSDIVIMLDDDIAGFYDGWWNDLIAPLLQNKNIIIVSARLLNPDGGLGGMMFMGDTGKDITAVPRVPTAAIAFRKTDLRFFEGYKLSGFEDDHFCAEMQERHTNGRIVINNRCKLIHKNEQKGQREGWEYNKKIFDSIWETSPDNRIRTRKTRYFSEYNEDKWLHENIFSNKFDGVFFECGAIDGINGSNTLFFERAMGWTGLCVEANPIHYERLKQNRTCKTDNIAIYDRSGDVEFLAIDGPLTGWGGISDAIESQHYERISKRIPKTNKQKIVVSCITLEDVLNKHDINKIDILSLDIEGAELNVLNVFPFSKFDIDVFVLENNFHNKDLDKIMVNNGYKKLVRLGVTDIWRR